MFSKLAAVTDLFQKIDIGDAVNCFKFDHLLDTSNVEVPKFFVPESCL